MFVLFIKVSLFQCGLFKFRVQKAEQRSAEKKRNLYKRCSKSLSGRINKYFTVGHTHTGHAGVRNHVQKNLSDWKAQVHLQKIPKNAISVELTNILESFSWKICKYLSFWCKEISTDILTTLIKLNSDCCFPHKEWVSGLAFCFHFVIITLQ